jgi:hypothetical protein
MEWGSEEVTVTKKELVHALTCMDRTCPQCWKTLEKTLKEAEK